MTQRRGFIWISMLLMAALAVAIFCRPRTVTEEPLQAEAAAADTVRPDSPRPRAQHCSHAAAADCKAVLAVVHTPDTARQWVEAKQYRNFVVELNSADTTDLKQLRGIGSTYASRIVKYRDRLGGFYSVAQLREVYGLGDSLYRTLVPHLTLDTQLCKKIDINHVALDTLKRHPYLDYWQAKALVRYRTESGNFDTPSDLLLVTLIDPTTFNKIKPYIACR